MRRFFVPFEDIKDKVLISDGKEVHHIRDVLRLKKDRKVIIFDGKGKEYDAAITSISDSEVELKVLNKRTAAGAKDAEICLACALPKRAKFDFIVEKATELGVSRIIPLKTSRTIVDLKGDREEKRISRYQEIAVNASKQSQRNSVPKIERVFSFKEALAEIKQYELAIIPCLSGQRQKIEEALLTFKGKSIIVFIGPEGDFTSQEVALAVKAGCQSVSLGSRVLKVDSAAFYVLAVINFISQFK